MGIVLAFISTTTADGDSPVFRYIGKSACSAVKVEKHEKMLRPGTRSYTLTCPS